MDVGHLTARGVPHGTPERTRVISDFVMWLFAVDDYCDETGLSHAPYEYAAFAAQVLRVLEAPEVDAFDANPYVASVRELRRRLEATGATGTQILRWSYGLRMFLFGQVRETLARGRSVRPDLVDFMTTRLETAGTFPVFALNDYARGTEVDGKNFNRPAVRAVCEMGIAVIGLDDDIVSLHKEMHRSPDDPNLVSLLARIDEAPLEQALAGAMDMRDRIMSRFDTLSTRILDTADEALTAYVSGMRTWVRSWLDWSYDVDRYVNPDCPAALTGGCRSDAPPQAGRALDNPAVSWWWNDLPDIPTKT
ncbi:terpene synthase family protein [Streptomyces sp. CA-249302]|uniref:terpene synthase family protein n=1 Tax=Streptomyces sp. CA-249302 TaxID=3240058 RepID=UPI003D8C595A